MSAGRCVNLWEPPSGELWVPAAQLKLSWFLAPSFGIGKMIDRTGMDGRTRGGIEVGKLNQCSFCLPAFKIFFSLYTPSHLLYHPASLAVPQMNMAEVHPLLFLGFAVFSLLLTKQELVKV